MGETTRTSRLQPASARTCCGLAAPRAEAQARVEALGGRATSSVSRETDCLVQGSDPGSKRDEAREPGADIIESRHFSTCWASGAADDGERQKFFLA